MCEETAAASARPAGSDAAPGSAGTRAAHGHQVHHAAPGDVELAAPPELTAVIVEL
ncbi:MAG TPA: hypothetical protein VFQ71_00735 [Gaiellales bacterium]|nr:hypothetical protein [Gaiellales bacterium]